MINFFSFEGFFIGRVLYKLTEDLNNPDLCEIKEGEIINESNRSLCQLKEKLFTKNFSMSLESVEELLGVKNYIKKNYIKSDFSFANMIALSKGGTPDYTKIMISDAKDIMSAIDSVLNQANELTPDDDRIAKYIKVLGSMESSIKVELAQLAPNYKNGTLVNKDAYLDLKLLHTRVESANNRLVTEFPKIEQGLFAEKKI